MKYLALILFTFSGMPDAVATDFAMINADTVAVEIKGTDVDARFNPVVVQVNPGDVVRFIVREGWHTVTAYHPDNRRPLRIPEKAKSFDSGLLKSGDIWFLKIETEGVYDFFCLPHERMGHVGRILSGPVKSSPDYPEGRIPDAVLKKLDTKITSF